MSRPHFHLSLFQDIGEALQLLEDSDWVLLDAVNRAIPGAAQDQVQVFYFFFLYIKKKNLPRYRSRYTYCLC